MSGKDHVCSGLIGVVRRQRRGIASANGRTIENMVGQKDRQAGRCGMGQRKKTSREDDDRTTSMGLFNTAEAYRLSAMALEQAQVEFGHADKPVQFLYAHAIELYLKALLRQGHSVEAIRKSFGHNTRLLVKEAEKLGLFVTAGDRDVFAIMEDTESFGLWRPQFLSPTWLNNFPFPSSAPLTLFSSLSGWPEQAGANFLILGLSFP